MRRHRSIASQPIAPSARACSVPAVVEAAFGQQLSRPSLGDCLAPQYDRIHG